MDKSPNADVPGVLTTHRIYETEIGGYQSDNTDRYKADPFSTVSTEREHCPWSHDEL
jgi:hypothetical protein